VGCGGGGADPGAAPEDDPPLSTEPEPRPPAPPALLEPSGPFAYESFDGASLERYAWVGERVALATVRADLDREAVTRLVAALDGAYGFYAECTRREPIRHRMYEGRLVIAQVPSTCGAGCGYLGWMGIELQDDFWEILYEGVRARNEFDQVPFYELGRNFWTFDPKMALVDPDPSGAIVTGFAVLMRFVSMDATGVTPAPFGSTPFSAFRATIESLVDDYEANPTLTFDNTLRMDQSPLAYGAADLFASFFRRLMRDHGGSSFLCRFYVELAAQPDRSTSQDAIDNMYVAASRAAGVDLWTTFVDRWRWPVRESARARTAP
jgi:hypothetical protein